MGVVDEGDPLVAGNGDHRGLAAGAGPPPVTAEEEGTGVARVVQGPQHPPVRQLYIPVNPDARIAAYKRRDRPGPLLAPTTPEPRTRHAACCVRRCASPADLQIVGSELHVRFKYALRLPVAAGPSPPCAPDLNSHRHRLPGTGLVLRYSIKNG